MNIGSRVCFDGEVTINEVKKENKQENKAIRGNHKKISIFVME